MNQYAASIIAALEAITDGALVHKRNCYLMQIRCAIEEGVGLEEACDRAAEWLAGMAILELDRGATLIGWQS